MNVAFVSTMNQRLYDFYGKRFLEEFSESASNEIKLFVIFEGEYPEEALNIGKNIIILPLLSDEHSKFIKYFGSLHEAKGLKIRIFNENGEKKINFTPDYRFDAIRFSFKPFSIHQSLNYLPDNIDYLIWTDADLRCKKKFESNDMLEFMPNSDEVMSYLGRKDSYSECGFLGFNLRNDKTHEYINRVIDIYQSGELFSLSQWHDSFIWDFVRKEFEELNETKFKDISGEGFNYEHVYIKSGLDKYFDHLKGPRKIDGNSSSDDRSKLIS
jgi:hypothetical protein